MATNRHRHFCFCFSSSAEAGSSQRDDFAPSSSNQTQPAASSSNQTQPALRDTIQNEDSVKVEGKYVVDTHNLIEHISKLLELREKEMLQHQEASTTCNFRWPERLKKLNAILSFGTDLNFMELHAKGVDFASRLEEVISGPVTTSLRGIGRASLAVAGLLVVAYTLERVHDLSDNKDGCWVLIKEMSQLASIVKKLSESPRIDTFDPIKEATTLVVEGAITCCTQLSHSGWKSFFSTTTDKADLSGITQKLNSMYLNISVDIGIRNLTAIEKRNPPPVGIDKSIAKVLDLLDCESDQKAVTVILHGFGGMGKTTLADAVSSCIKEYKHSHVQLFENINSKPNIIELQKKILKDLMGPKEPVPDIRQYQDGRQELGERLEKMEAFIYIDNVLKADALEELLPQNMTTAKKVRLLLTARDEDVKKACPKSSTEPKIYKMQEILHEDAMTILKREIEEGVTETQFSDIIQICGGIPLMLTLAAAFIRRADNKEEACATLMEQKDKWTNVQFKEMRYAFAYDALPQPCKDPFLDISTYFNGWNWDIVKDIVGDDALMMLKSRALVTRTTNGFASVHDVILTLARGMSKEESNKEVRRKFTNASELKKFLEEGDTEGITGIWLTERKEDGDDRKEVVVQASALDKMQKSLRVLQLGNSIKVEGNCNEIFKELCFFKANISRLPFTVSQLTQLRYLSYEPPNWVPSRLPSSLAIINFNGKTFQTYK